MDGLKSLVEAGSTLRKFPARAGIVLLTFILYADASAYLIWKAPLLDAVADGPRDGRTVAVAALCLALFPVLTAAAARAMRIIYYSFLVLLADLAALVPWVQVIASTIEFVFRTGSDREAAVWRAGRSKRLLERALSGVAPALDLYNQRRRETQEAQDLGDESLALSLALTLNGFLVTPAGILVRAWGNIPSGNASVIIGLIGLGATWMLACHGLQAGHTTGLDLDLDAVLGSEESSPQRARRPGD